MSSRTAVATQVVISAVLQLLSSAGYATEVSVENFTNTPVAVASAYNRFNGNQINWGWVTLNPGDEKTFGANDNQDLFLRVESGGNEVTFNGFNRFEFWPATNDGFQVIREPDDQAVWVLQAANQMPQVWRRGQPLPQGWNERRFFGIGPGQHKLRIQ